MRINSLDDLQSDCSRFKRHVKHVASHVALDFRQIAKSVDELRRVDKQSAWRRALHSWSRNHMPGKWFRGQSAEEGLMESLVSASEPLVQDLEDIYDGSQRLAKDLGRLSSMLSGIAIRLRNEEVVSSTYCDRLRRGSSGYLGLNVAWMAPWIPSPSDSACDQGKLPERCCTTPPDFLTHAQTHILVLIRQASRMSALSELLSVQLQVLFLLRNMTEQSGRLTFARKDLDNAQAVATELLKKFEHVETKFRGTSLEEELAPETV